MRLPVPLLRRNPNLHKNDFGHVLVVAGSASMLGAAALTSLAAMRAGAGLVTVAVPTALDLSLQRKVAHVVMTLPLPHNAYPLIKSRFDKYQSMVIGPGLGLATATQKLVLQLVIHYPGPMVIDADALNSIADDPAILLKAQGMRILTPHPGEMANLVRKTRVFIEANRMETAKRMAQDFQCVVLLKGPQTVIASPEGKIITNRTGNVGMATAGSGDVLSGIIGAFLAQGIDPLEATCLAAHCHGAAGDLAIKKINKASLIATDLIDFLPKILNR